MNELTLFSNAEFGTIRSLTIEGEPWFVGKDVASALGYGNGKSPVNAVSNHVDEEDKGVTEMMTPGGIQKITIINESGLYSLIFGSKLESARRFKRWVTSEVLPTIRKTGSYGMKNDYDKMELARIISSCKSATAVKTISALFEIGVKQLDNSPNYGNDSVGRFLENYDSRLLREIPTRVLYEDYVIYCSKNELESLTQGNFSRRVHRLTGLVVRRRRINGELTGFFTME